MEQLGLPESWEEVSVSQISGHKSKNVKPADFQDEVFELYSVPIFPTGKPELVKGSEIGSSKQVVQPGDVLVCKINPRINRVWWVPEKGKYRQIASSEWIVVRQPNIDTRYLVAYFSKSSFRDLLCSEVTGVGGSLTRAQPKKVATYPVRVAPRAEQTRIANKLDELLAQVDTIKARVDAIPGILKRFRQSVLAAAVSGRLTEEWRANNEPLQTARELIAIDAASKQALLDIQPELKRKKSTLQSDIDEEYIFEISDSWEFTTWGKISEWITYGFTRPMPKSEEGVRLLTAKDVHNFDLRIDTAGFTPQEAFDALSDKDRPDCGDLLITKDGTIGRTVLIRENSQFCINQSVAVCWLRSTGMDKDYLELLANAEHTQRFVRDKAQGMAIQHLSIIDFAKCPVPVPPIDEQKEIVAKVRTLFELGNQISERVNVAQARVNALTQSILAKAFRGELVPQNPDDEPASVLLERIQVIS